MALSVTCKEKPSGVYLLAIGGSLDASTSALLEAEIDVLLASAHGLVLDFEFLEFISSAGLRVVLKAQKQLSGKGSSLKMMNLQPQIKKVFDSIKALPAATVFSSLEEMDEYLAYMQAQHRE